jgi:hypothetical protein
MNYTDSIIFNYLKTLSMSTRYLDKYREYVCLDNYICVIPNSLNFTELTDSFCLYTIENFARRGAQDTVYPGFTLTLKNMCKNCVNYKYAELLYELGANISTFYTNKYCLNGYTGKYETAYLALENPVIVQIESLNLIPRWWVENKIKNSIPLYDSANKYVGTV